MRFAPPGFLLAALATPCLLHAQVPDEKGFTCLANHPAELQRHLAANPGALERALQARAFLDARTQGFTRQDGERSDHTISVVVHIIHNNGPENISDAQVYDAMRILNEDFNKQNPDWVNVRPEFLPLVGDVGIRFELAKRDPAGNCTNGITRTVSSQTYNGDYEMTQLIQWPRDRYMNIWVCADAAGAAGYTYYPEWLDGWPEADGMVVRSDYVGSIGTSNPGRSRVISHEVGHWLNLKHCWGDSNSPGEEANCWMDDDVDDTPLTKGWASCYLAGASCGSALDNVENYMEYSYCDKMFTHGQADRMIAALTSPIAQRDQLWQPATLALTGVNDAPTLCVAQFGRSATEVCQGGTVQYTDQSYHGVVQRNWSFPGGTPATSTEAAPLVTYSTPGTYGVSLTVSDGTNTLTADDPVPVRVLPAPGTPYPWNESFEALDALPSEGWIVRNPDGDNAWELTQAASFNGLKAARLMNGPMQAGRTDNLVSATFDMTGAATITVSFRYAYAQRNAANDDRLRLYVSKDCGQTWSMRKQLRGGVDLNTAAPAGDGFVPAGPWEWGHAVANNISSGFHTGQFRVRFEFLSDGGNHVYLDDINIYGSPVAVADADPDTSSGLLVVPNPADGEATLYFTARQAGPAAIVILDASGRQVAGFLHRMAAPGAQQVALPMENLAPGAYLLRVEMPSGVHAARFVRQ